MKTYVLRTVRWESGFKIAPNWPQIVKMTMKSQFSDLTSSPNFLDVVLFLLTNLFIGPSFMSISSLLLELSQFPFIIDWPEIWKSEIPLSEIRLISGNWDKLGIPKLAGMFLKNYYCMLQNVRVIAFTISVLIMENQQGEGEEG